MPMLGSSGDCGEYSACSASMTSKGKVTIVFEDASGQLARFIMIDDEPPAIDTFCDVKQPTSGRKKKVRCWEIAEELAKQVPLVQSLLASVADGGDRSFPVALGGDYTALARAFRKVSRRGEPGRIYVKLPFANEIKTNIRGATYDFKKRDCEGHDQCYGSAMEWRGYLWLYLQFETGSGELERSIEMVGNGERAWISSLNNEEGRRISRERIDRGIATVTRLIDLLGATKK